jgi:hypothetical protein
MQLGFIVGHEMKYEINGKNAKIKAPEGKHVECKIVPVEDMSGSQ